MSDSRRVSIRVETSIGDIDPLAWDRAAGATASSPPPNPFVSHAFLHALEVSGSATADTGWLPQHLALEDEDGAVIGTMPCYLKSHSQGEYVFDYGWADAYERAGGRYYPKLQVSVPFTPATGPRILTGSCEGAEGRRDVLAAGLVELVRRHGVSSAHLTFLPKSDWTALGANGFLQRTDQQFHWLNDGYTTFDDFLDALASRKRKQIRKERREALTSDIEIEWITGADLTEAHWDAFWTFYMDTGSRKWGHPYLTRSFFSTVSQTMPERTLLVMAKRGGRYVAGALNFIGADTLYGRNWGCIEDHPFLHFEVCYYQAIEFAIARGLGRVEAGAQGAHKLARGYVPTTTYSAHYIADPRLRTAIDDYLSAERRHVDLEAAALAQHVPFKKTG